MYKIETIATSLLISQHGNVKLNDYNCYNVRNMSDYIRFFSTFFLSCFIFVSFHVFITNWHYYCYFNSQILLSISHSFWIELLHIIFKLLRAIIRASNFIKSNFKLPLHYQNQFKSRINEWRLNKFQKCCEHHCAN